MNHKPDSPATIHRWLLAHPEFAVPGIALFLYIISSRFIDCYASYFGARGHWFSPSLVQMIGLSTKPLAFAALSFALWLWLDAALFKKSRQWLVPYLIHVVIFGLPGVFYYIAKSATNYKIDIVDTANCAVYILSYIAAPIYFRHKYRRRVGGISAENEAAGDRQHMRLIANVVYWNTLYQALWLFWTAVFWIGSLAAWSTHMHASTELRSRSTSKDEAIRQYIAITDGASSIRIMYDKHGTHVIYKTNNEEIDLGQPKLR